MSCEELRQTLDDTEIGQRKGISAVPSLSVNVLSLVGVGMCQFVGQGDDRQRLGIDTEDAADEPDRHPVNADLWNPEIVGSQDVLIDAGHPMQQVAESQFTDDTLKRIPTLQQAVSLVG